MMRPSIAFVIALAGCAGSGKDDSAPPTLEITSPMRGTVSESTQVTVAGHAEHASKVTVNGTDVALAKDGSFSTTVDVGAGIAIIETHAIGSADIRDVRAVLAGPVAPTDGSVHAPLGAHASQAALVAIGDVMATDAAAVDYTAAVQPLNPVYNNGGCLGAVIDITSVDLSGVQVALTPNDGSLGTDVTIDNVVVKLHASYKVACIGGSTTITVSASAAHLHGDLGIGVTGDSVATSIGDVSVQLDGFSLDVGSVPGAISNLFDGVVRGRVESALTTVIHDKVPGIADHALAGLLAKPVTANVLGHASTIAVTPSAASISPMGVFVAVDTTVKVDGGDGAMALSQAMPMTPDLVEQAHGIGIAVADDAVNQLFGGLWAAGAFDKTMPITSVGPIGALLDPSATTLELKLSLPPTVTSDANGLRLAVGDLIITTKDDAGTVVQQLALSVATTLTAGPSQSNKLLLTVGQPELHAQVLAQSPGVIRPLTDDTVEGIISGVWGLVGDAADQALANLAMPDVAGIQLGAPTLAGKAGYVVADVALP